MKYVGMQCDTMYLVKYSKLPFYCRFFFPLAFFLFVSSFHKAFSPLEQLARADIFFASTGAHILAKWSKTLQSRNQIRILKIPYLNKSILCPVTALKNLLSMTPSSDNKPLFQVKYMIKMGFLDRFKTQKSPCIYLSVS